VVGVGRAILGIVVVGCECAGPDAEADAEGDGSDLSDLILVGA